MQNYKLGLHKRKRSLNRTEKFASGKSTAITGNDRRRYQRHTDENQNLKQIFSETALNDTCRVNIQNVCLRYKICSIFL